VYIYNKFWFYLDCEQVSGLNQNFEASIQDVCSDETSSDDDSEREIAGWHTKKGILYACFWHTKCYKVPLDIITHASIFITRMNVISSESDHDEEENVTKMDKELQLQAILESSTLEYQLLEYDDDELLQKGIDASLSPTGFW